MIPIPARRYATILLAAVGGTAVFALEPAPSASQPWVSDGTGAYPQPALPAAPALPSRALTLGDLIDLALRDNPDTRGSWQVAVQAAANLNRAQGGFLPQLSGSLAFNKQYQRTDGALSAGPISIPQLQIVNSPGVFVTPSANLTWLLWDFGATKAGVDAARAGLVAANFQHDRTLQGVVRQVQAAYFGYDSARGAFDAADAADALAGATLQETLLERQSGLAGVPAELQARQAAAQARLQREQARQAFEQARAQLFELAGLPPSTQVAIAEEPAGAEPAPALNAVDALVSQALATRPDLAARYAQLAALEDQLKAVQRSFLPSVAFGASANRLRGAQSTLSSSGVDNPTAIQQAQISRYNTAGYIETASAGITINANFTNLAGYRSAMAEKRAEIDAARSALDAAMLAAEHDVWMSVDACRSARDQYTQARALLEISQRSYAAAARARTSGLESELDLLQAQQGLAQARYSLVDARAHLFTSAADLAFATGQTAMGSEPAGG